MKMTDIQNEFDLIHIEHVQGQDNYILKYSPVNEGDTVGYISFSIFENDLQIDMIEVYTQYKNKGYGKKMLHELQRRFPDTEIHFGITTEDGSKLRQSLSYKKIKTPYYEKFQELSKLKNKFEQLVTKVEEFYKKDFSELTEKEKSHFKQLIEKYNEMHDEIEDYENELENEKPYKYIIVT